MSSDRILRGVGRRVARRSDMSGDVVFYEAVVQRSWIDGGTLQAPLFRIDGGPLRRAVNGEIEMGIIKSIEPMREERQTMLMPLVRQLIGV
jgi:hypothetical protein